MYDFDYPLFLWLNFDGGHAMDLIMTAISGTPLWIPLYVLILWLVWRKYGWKNAVAFLVCMALAMALADMFCGIFKHTGLLKHLWDDFPARQRPMFTAALQGQVHVPSYKHGPYGTVSSHAATVAAMAIFSALTLRNRLFTTAITFVTLLICYSRIYLACHFPIDLALGLAVGLVAGGVIFPLWKKLGTLIEKFS